MFICLTTDWSIHFLPDWTGVVHAMEVPFVFGAPFKNIQDPFVNLMELSTQR